jgi:hypothetical protein
MLPSALRAEALVDLAAQHCRREPGDDSMPDRYRVGVTLTPDDLQHLPVAGCDSELFRLVVNAAGEVLDVGRTTRAWTNGIRRAANQRDHGCVFPGCDRPPSWCDLHHCIEWHPCGTTSIDNAASLCRRHHTFIHAHGWRVVIPRARGKPIVLRPDGAPYTIDRVMLR